MTTHYHMNGAFDLSDAHDLSETTDEDQAVRYTWDLLALHSRNCGLEDLESGEHPQHGESAAFIRRFNMYESTVSELTALGREYVEQVRGKVI